MVGFGVMVLYVEVPRTMYVVKSGGLKVMSVSDPWGSRIERALPAWLCWLRVYDERDCVIFVSGVIVED